MSEREPDADDAPSGLPDGFDDQPLGPPEDELERPADSGPGAQPGIPEPGVEPPSDA